MLYSVIYLSSFLANLLLAFLVLLKNKSSKVNRAFFWFPLSASGWILTLYLFYFHNQGNALLFGRLNFVFTELIAYSAFWFGYWFPEKVIEFKKSVRFLIIFWLIVLIAVTLFTDLIDKNEIVTADGIDTVFGSLYFIFVAHFLIFTSLLIILPLLKYKKLSNLSKYQVNYLLIGAFLTFIFSSTTNIFLPLFFNYYNSQHLGPLGTFFIILSIAYAIVKHRLMDIKIVMRRSTVYFFSFLTIILLALLIRYTSSNYFPNLVLWSDLVILFLAIFFFPYIRAKYYALANKYFFSSLYDSSDVIAQLMENLRTTLNLGKLYEFIFNSLNSAFHLKAFAVLSYSEKEGNYSLNYNRNFHILSTTIFEGNIELHNKYISQNKPIVVSELAKNRNQNIEKTIKMLSALKVEILVPLNVKDKTIGLLALGEKESGDIYNIDDFKMLEVIGAQAAIAFENAMLYEQTRQFNEKLEAEVENATRDLKQANEKLKKLDASKSEFISIASHQLRTPLTVIKGYISMMLEGSFGKISAPQRESLDKVYLSNERLIRLVENLLNLSRIESGRLQFKYEQINLETIVESVVEELSSKAKEKKLKLEYKKPAKSLPKIMIDEEKIRQVVMNLIDNSIKYTSKGNVTVSLNKEGNNILFCVSDSGMGVDPNDMPHLFQKFQRGTGTFLVHTEGTGLGLYVAKEMVEQHKGKIWAESKGRDRGSKFIFTIPVN